MVKAYVRNEEGSEPPRSQEALSSTLDYLVDNILDVDTD